MNTILSVMNDALGGGNAFPCDGIHIFSDNFPKINSLTRAGLTDRNIIRRLPLTGMFIYE